MNASARVIRLLPLLLAGCTAAPPAAAPAPGTVSVLEEQLGAEAERVITQLYRVDSDPRAVNRLRLIGRQLLPVTARGRIAYSFHVLATEERNAFGLPNGRIFLTRGMLELLPDDAELAAVVAHELAHVNHRHSLAQLERYHQTLWRRVAVAGTVGLVPVAGRKLAYQLTDRGFDHQQELEADRTGAAYLRQAGYDPRAMVRMFRRWAADPALRRAGGFLATHPGETARIQHLEEFLAAP